MIRNLHVGRFQPDLEDALAGELASLRAGDALARHLIIAPNHLLARHLAVLVARRAGGWLGLEILTLGGLVARLAALEMPRSGQASLSAPAQELLSRRLAIDAVADGGYFHPLRETAGFPSALLETFRDLEESLVTAGTLAGLAALAGRDGVERGRGDPSRNRELARRAGEIARLYARYEEELAGRRLLDEAGRVHAAARAIARGGADAAIVAGARRVLLYGIYDLNPLQRSLVQSIISGRDASVFFPWTAAPEYQYAAPALAWFRELGFVETRDGDHAPAAPRAATAPAIEVRVLIAHSEHQEIRESLRAALFDPGAGSTTAVLVPRWEDYVAPIDAFSEASEIPVARAVASRAPSDPAAMAAVLLLRMESSRRGVRRPGGRALGRREVMAFAAVAPLENPEAAPNDWDRLSLRLGIRGGDDWERRLAGRSARLRHRRSAPGPADDDAGEAARIDAEIALVHSLRGFVDSLRVALDMLPARGRWSEIARGLEGALRRIGLRRTPGDELERALRELATFDQLGGDTELGEFALFLERVLRAARATDGDRPETAAIRAADLLNARGVPADTVIITGLTDGAFPRRPRQDPLLLDHERRRLNELAAGRFTLPMKLDRAREEALLFRLAMESAERRVILTMTRADPVTGRERTPSPFLLETLRALTGDPAVMESYATLPMVERVPPAGLPHGDPRTAFDGAEFDFAWLARGAEARAALLARRPAIASPLRRLEERWRPGELNAASGLVGGEAALDYIRGLRRSALSRVVSTSRLEDYARCPQLYFLKNVLGLDVRDEPELTIALPASDRGRLYHDVLAAFVGTARDHGLLPWRRDRFPALLALLDETIATESARFETETAVGPALFWRETQRELRADLRRFVAEEIASGDDWIPAYVEYPFGSEAPLEIALAGGDGEVRFALRGRIDRVDLDPGGTRARIIDYKTGDTRVPEKDPLQGGRLLQLPLYARAVERVLRERHRGLVVEDALYYRVSQRKTFGPSVLAGEVNRALEPRLAAITSALIGGAAAGLFFVFPPDRSEFCARCDFRPVCGPGMGALAELKAGDERMAVLAGIRDGPRAGEPEAA